MYPYHCEKNVYTKHEHLVLFVYNLSSVVCESQTDFEYCSCVKSNLFVQAYQQLNHIIVCVSSQQHFLRWSK